MWSPPPSYDINQTNWYYLLRFKCSKTPNSIKVKLYLLKPNFKQNSTYCELSAQRPIGGGGYHFFITRELIMIPF